LRENNTFLHEVDFDVKLVEEHPILKVTIKTVGFLDQQSADAGMTSPPTPHPCGRDSSMILRLHIRFATIGRTTWRPDGPT
jgi:hypothetical protein